MSIAPMSDPLQAPVTAATNASQTAAEAASAAASPPDQQPAGSPSAPSPASAVSLSPLAQQMTGNDPISGSQTDSGVSSLASYFQQYGVSPGQIQQAQQEGWTADQIQEAQTLAGQSGSEQPSASVPNPGPGNPLDATPPDSVKSTPFVTLGTISLPGGVTLQVRYDPNDPNAKAAAQATLDSAGNDLTQLGKIFGIDPSQLSSKNWVVDVTNQIPGASHGFGDGPSGTHIIAEDAVIPNVTDAQGNPVYDTPGLFVAEAVETFEAKINNGWQEADTNGEGLSRALAFTLHPEAALSPPLGQGAIEQDWWNHLPSPNYVGQNAGPFQVTGPDGKTTTVNGDNNSRANGAATLFLYYEHDVLGKSWAEIAQAGGNTLYDNYNKLTGNDPNHGGLSANDVFDQFIGELAKHQNGSNLILPENAGGYPPYDPFAPPVIVGPDPNPNNPGPLPA